jgi:uncharacterized protein (UPF0303 family)
VKQLSLSTLRDLDAAACDSDARVVVDLEHRGSFQVRTHDGQVAVVQVSGLREMRLVGQQLIALADHMGSRFEMIEVKS